MKIRIALLVLLLAGILLSIGCTTSIVSPGNKTSAEYRLGKLQSNVTADIGTTYKATEAAMQELGLSVVQRTRDQLEAKVIARDAQDTKITVQLGAITDEMTQLDVRVDSLSKARRIYEAILANLPKA